MYVVHSYRVHGHHVIYRNLVFIIILVQGEGFVARFAIFISISLLNSILMALIIANEESDIVQKQRVNQLEAEFRFVLDESEVDSRIQAKIASIGFNTVNKFARWEDSPDKIRASMTTDLEVDVGNIPGKVATAAVVAAWELAKERVTKRQKDNAEAHVNELPKKMRKTDYITLLRSYSRVFKELKDSEAPACTYLEQKLEQIEEGELVAESFKSVLSKSEASKDVTGTVKLQRST